MISASALVILVSLMARCHSAPRHRRDEFLTDFDKIEAKINTTCPNNSHDTPELNCQTIKMTDCKNDYQYVQYVLQTLNIPCTNTNVESCSLLHRLRDIVENEQILCRTPVAPKDFSLYIKNRYQESRVKSRDQQHKSK